MTIANNAILDTVLAITNVTSLVVNLLIVKLNKHKFYLSLIPSLAEH